MSVIIKAGKACVYLWGNMYLLSSQVPEHPFKWKVRGGGRCLKPPPRNMTKWRGQGMPVKTSKLVAESGYHSPDPLVDLLGCVNEATVVVEGWR